MTLKRRHMERTERALARLRERVPVPAIFVVGAILAICMVFPARCVAQEGWSPTVATAPGGNLTSPPGAKLSQPMVDPMFFPSSRTTAPPPARNPLPQGAWSPIITGALPNSAGTMPGAGSTAVGNTNRFVPPVDTGRVVRTPLKNAVAAADPPPASAGTKAPAAAPGAIVPGTGSHTAAPAASGAGGAGTAQPAAADNSLFGKPPGPLDVLPSNATAAQQYCFNTADSAADARFAWQAKKIKDMEAELDKRAKQLEAKTEEYKTWMARRDEFSRKAHEKLVGFYSRMRPDAAAVQLATLDEEMAAAVVTKLETKVASAILGEMDPERAAKIAAIISGAAKIPPQKRRAVDTTENRPPDPAAGAPPAEQPRS